MRDGDYHDIWIAVAFSFVVLLLGKAFIDDSAAGAWIVFFIALGGGTLVRQHIADRERRKRGEGN